MRYPGHMRLMNFFFHELLMRERRDLAGEILTERETAGQRRHRLRPRLGGRHARGAAAAARIRPRVPADRACGGAQTAIAWTTSASVVAVIEMVRDGTLPQRGFLKQEEIPLERSSRRRPAACSSSDDATIERERDERHSSHYSRGVLRERLARGAHRRRRRSRTIRASTRLRRTTSFHGRGLEATVEMADALAIAPPITFSTSAAASAGPARYFRQPLRLPRHRHRSAPRILRRRARADASRRSRREGRIPHGDALAMPFADERFDGAYSMNVSMNIADKAALYREIHRVLKPGGWLMLSEIAKGPGSDPDYPTPWAASAKTSFLASPDATRSGLAAAGFDVVQIAQHARPCARRHRAGARDGRSRRKAAASRRCADTRRDRGAAMANTARALADGRLEPIEVLATRRR
jgi:SAM-dependent methyltransferase